MSTLTSCVNVANIHTIEETIPRQDLIPAFSATGMTFRLHPLNQRMRRLNFSATTPSSAEKDAAKTMEEHNDGTSMGLTHEMSEM